MSEVNEANPASETSDVERVVISRHRGNICGMNKQKNRFCLCEKAA